MKFVKALTVATLNAAILVWASSAFAADDEHPQESHEKSSVAVDHDHDADDDHGHDEGGGHGEATANTNPLSIDPDLAICTAIVFVILMLVLGKFAWKPIMEGLEQREKSIADQIDEARLGAEKATETLRQYQAKLDASADEVREAMAEARRAAETAKEEILVEAKEAASRERDRAVADIEAAKNAALVALAQTSVDSAVSLASKIVRKQVSSEDHADLIRESLDQFSNQN